MKNKKKYLICVFVVLIVVLSGCDDNYISSIPNYAVSLQLNLTSTYSTFKNSVNQYLIFDKPVNANDLIGFGGVLVYTGFDGNYYAFDLACPHEAPEQNLKVIPNDEGKAVCETCGTVYNISFGIGDPIEGPSKETLKRYKTSPQGDWLIITN